MTQRIRRREFLSLSAAGTAAIWVCRTVADETGKAVAAPTDRVGRRIERLQGRISGPPPREICFSRARLMTASYRKTEGEPAIIRRARAMMEIADSIPIEIDPEELIVGNVSPRPRAAYFAPETFDWSRHRPGRAQVLSDRRFSDSLSIHYTIPDEIADYWKDKPSGGTLGHYVAGYDRVLRKGFCGLREAIASQREQHQRGGQLGPSSKPT